jgi:hypothetical protein
VIPRELIAEAYRAGGDDDDDDDDDDDEYGDDESDGSAYEDMDEAEKRGRRLEKLNRKRGKADGHFAGWDDSRPDDKGGGGGGGGGGDGKSKKKTNVEHDDFGDDYDYEKHLKPISDAGVFVPAALVSGAYAAPLLSARSVAPTTSTTSVGGVAMPADAVGATRETELEYTGEMAEFEDYTGETLVKKTADFYEARDYSSDGDDDIDWVTDDGGDEFDDAGVDADGFDAFGEPVASSSSSTSTKTTVVVKTKGKKRGPRSGAIAGFEEIQDDFVAVAMMDLDDQGEAEVAAAKKERAAKQAIADARIEAERAARAEKAATGAEAMQLKARGMRAVDEKFDAILASGAYDDENIGSGGEEYDDDYDDDAGDDIDAVVGGGGGNMDVSQFEGLLDDFLALKFNGERNAKNGGIDALPDNDDIGDDDDDDYDDYDDVGDDDEDWVLDETTGEIVPRAVDAVTAQRLREEREARRVARKAASKEARQRREHPESVDGLKMAPLQAAAGDGRVIERQRGLVTAEVPTAAKGLILAGVMEMTDPDDELRELMSSDDEGGDDLDDTPQLLDKAGAALKNERKAQRAKRAKEQAMADTISIAETIHSLYPSKPRSQWDAETILSTRTNTENHPKVIPEPGDNSGRRIRLDAFGLPKGYARGGGYAGDHEKARREAGFYDGSDDEEEEEEEEYESGPNLGVKRSKTETKEEKKARKEAVKAAAKAARERKKALKNMFTHERGAHMKKMAGEAGAAVGALRIS